MKKLITASVILLVSFILGGQVAKANELNGQFERVEVLASSVEISEYAELAPNSFEIELKMVILANNSCEQEFAGFVKLGTNDYVAIHKTSKDGSCLKLMREVTVSQKISLDFFTKSFPAVEFITINGKKFWLENDLGLVRIRK